MLINYELEKEILASLITEPKLIEDIEINEKWFYGEDNRMIFETLAMLGGSLENEYELFAYLRQSERSKHIGIQTIQSIKQSCLTTSQVDNNAFILKQQHLTNEVQRLSEKTSQLPTAESMLELKIAMEDLENARVKKDSGDVSDTIDNMIKYLEVDRPSGVKTYPIMNTFLGGGFYPGSVTTIAARPSEGKSVLAVNLVDLAIQRNENIICDIFTLEMNQEEVLQRFLSKWAKIPVVNLRKANRKLNAQEKAQVAEMLRNFKKRGINIDFESDAIEKIVRQMKRRSLQASSEGKQYFVVIDYIGLIKTEKKHFNRVAEVSDITATIKRIATTRGISVIQLAQMNRGVESRGSDSEPALPVLSDLRDSGSIEQDSDVVLFIHRPEGLTSDKFDLIARKNRQGSLATMHFEFTGENMDIKEKYNG